MRIFHVAKVSPRFHITAAAFIITLSLVLVAIGVRGTVLAETVWAGATLAALLELYFTIALFRGLRYDHGVVRWGDAWRKAWDHSTDGIDLSNVSRIDFPDLGDDPLSLILAVLLGLLLAIIFILAVGLLAWIGVNLVILTMITFIMPMYWVFRRSLRVVMLHTRRCRGDLVASMLIGLRYAIPYALVIAAVFCACETVVRMT